MKKSRREEERTAAPGKGWQAREGGTRIIRKNINKYCSRGVGEREKNLVRFMTLVKVYVYTCIYMCVEQAEPHSFVGSTEEVNNSNWPSQQWAALPEFFRFFSRLPEILIHRRGSVSSILYFPPRTHTHNNNITSSPAQRDTRLLFANALLSHIVVVDGSFFFLLSPVLPYRDATIIFKLCVYETIFFVCFVQRQYPCTGVTGVSVGCYTARGMFSFFAFPRSLLSYTRNCQRGWGKKKTSRHTYGKSSRVRAGRQLYTRKSTDDDGGNI